eukprot:gene9927-10470_t
MMSKTHPPSPLRPARPAARPAGGTPHPPPSAMDAAASTRTRRGITASASSAQSVTFSPSPKTTSKKAYTIATKAVAGPAITSSSTTTPTTTPKVQRRSTAAATTSMSWMSSLYAPRPGDIIGSPNQSPKSWRRARSFTGPSSSNPSTKTLGRAVRPFGTSPALVRRSSWPKRPTNGQVRVEVLTTEYTSTKKKDEKEKSTACEQQRLPDLPNTPKTVRANKLGLPIFKACSTSTAASSPLGSRTSSPSSFTTWSEGLVSAN